MQSTVQSTLQSSLTGKVALVTGGSRGIGRAVALRLAAAKADVAVLATTVDRAEAVAEEVRALGVRALALGADVSDAEQARAAVDRVVAELGSVDILINNAGITRDGLFLRMSDEDVERVLDVNLKGCFNFCRAVARPMTKARWGRIINVTSIVGLMGNAGQANYAAAKAGMVGLTKSLAKELGSRGVTVNAIAPGFISTDMTSGLPEGIREESKKRIPLGRFGEPEDIAEAAIYLCADAGAYVTGHTLVVDGGMSL